MPKPPSSWPLPRAEFLTLAPGSFPWWTFSLQGKDFLQVCEYLPQQSYVMPLLNLMTSNKPKRDRYNTLYFSYGHNMAFNFDYTLSRFNDYFAAHKVSGSRFSGFFTWRLSNMGWYEVIWLTPARRTFNIYWPYMLGTNSHPQKLANNLITMIGNNWDFCLRKYLM